MIPIRRFLHSPRARRGLAASLVVLATGGLVLARSEHSGSVFGVGTLSGDGSSNFSGPGASGTLALSHTKVLASGEQTVFAELRLRADDERASDAERAPLSLAIVFDTSGSMSGDKIQTSKNSVVKLLQQMRPDDEVAFVRYDDDIELVQSLAPVARVRSELIARVESFTAGGGTNIPPALERGFRALSSADAGRVRRVVLVSDGLDSNRSLSESHARNALESRVTVSALGIGLDFDESYMSAVANAGRGNFGFVKDGAALAQFLTRELDETASTVIDSAHATLRLPDGTRFVRAVGAEVAKVDDGEVDLLLGSLYAGDERRVIVELEVAAEHGQALALDADVDWNLVGGDHARVRIADLGLVGERDAREVSRSRNSRVWANAISATASLRQLAAAEAFARGDKGKADALIAQNEAELSAAAADAPAEAAAPLRRQLEDANDAKQKFRAAAPGTDTGKAAAKAAAHTHVKNLSRPSF